VRYYVVCKSEFDDIAPHIVAEVVRDHTETNKDATLASALAGERRVVVTRAELLDHPLGLQALKAWDSEDDTVYDDEREAMRARQDTPRRGLRLVR
jgi:hypothetical protein